MITIEISQRAFLAGQWVRLHATNAGGLGLTPGQETRSHMLGSHKLRVYVPQLKITRTTANDSCTATETQHSQTHTCIHTYMLCWKRKDLSSIPICLLLWATFFLLGIKYSARQSDSLNFMTNSLFSPSQRTQGDRPYISEAPRKYLFFKKMLLFQVSKWETKA